MADAAHRPRPSFDMTGRCESSEDKVQLPIASPDQEKHDVGVGQPPDSFGPAPDGGLKAWLVAAGGCCLFFCCLGFSNAFGVFQEYYMSNQLRGVSPDNIAWIGSISAFLQFAAGGVGGPLFDRFGEKVIRPAAVAYLVAMMLLSLCKTYWQIMLVQGILMGISQGLLQFPAFAAVFQHFDKHRAAAMGIVVAGSSLGGIVIPIATSKMLNDSDIDFGWSVRIIGFVIMPFIAFALVTVKARLPSRKTAFWPDAAVFRNPRFVLLAVSLFFTFIGLFTPLFYLPTYAVTRGMDATLAGYLSAILNGASTFGRVIPGMLADKYGRVNTYGFGTLACGIIIFCMNSATSTAALVVYAVIFGFWSGTIISGASAAFSLCVDDPRDVGKVMGVGMLLGALGGLMGPPVNGAMVERYGGFLEVSMFSGAVCLVGGMVALAMKLFTEDGIFGRT